MSGTRRRSGLAALIAAGLLLAGCGGGSDEKRSDPEAPAAVVPAAAPDVGACYDIDVAAALELSSSAPAVPCSGRHTSVTVSVGTLDPVADGHLLAIDSTRLQRQVANRCRAKVDAHVGGSAETRRLSRVQAVWFSPTLKQFDTGARWFRCDLVIADGATTFARLPARTKGLLASASALNRYGTCGTAAPGSPDFTRVSCAAKHSWRARASINLPAGAVYLGKAAGKAADSACRDIDARRETNLTKLRWSFEWPTRAQWSNGQRYGLCWTPD
ncbi:hypothetical protein ABIE44_000301 [Marmoricola sp. OAE513]|uniref:septum formation family protein n=1 Tax=Marmoricola sp. OAE513 TaxID=2817894 RepID=UPI001AE1041B